MAKCEMKFVEFEHKMQRIEASLLIVEAKMASIPDVDLKPSSSKKTDDKTETTIEKEPQTSTSAKDTTTTEPLASTSKAIETVSEENIVIQTEASPDEHDKSSGVKACDDTRYRKYFKMLQFGVPPPAVKLKMANEGVDPNVLDDPNRILEDGVAFVAQEE